MEIVKINYLKHTFKYDFLNKILKCSNKTKFYNNLISKKIKSKQKIKKDYLIINENGTKTLLYFHSGEFSKNPLNYQLNFIKKLATLTNYKIYIPFYTSPNPKDMLKIINSLNPHVLISQGIAGGITFSLYKNFKNIQKIISISPWMQFNNQFIDIKVKENIKDLINPYLTELDDNIESLIINGNKEFLSSYINLFCKNNSNKNIKWLEYYGMAEGFVFYPTKESIEPTHIIANFIKN